MLELALWLKKNGFRADQVQAFLPSPMATATAMYHSGKNPLKRVSRTSEEVVIPKGIKVRRLHKAFLRYHDPENWPILREALKRMGRADLIGNGKHHLLPAYQPIGASRGRPGTTPLRTQHTGLPKAGPAFARRAGAVRGKPAAAKQAPLESGPARSAATKPGSTKPPAFRPRAKSR
jgi:hypothetical protein